MTDNKQTAPIFSGLNAAVVGGSGGVGKALSRNLAQNGASVLIHGGHNQAKLTALIDELLADGLTADGILSNLDDAHAARALSRRVIGTDVLCVSYGPFLQKPIDQTSCEELERIVSHNFILPVKLIKAALPRMTAKRFGRILVFGGTRTDAIRGFRTNAIYAAAKTALASFVKSCAVSYAEYGVTCNMICPGFVDAEYLTDAERAKIKEKTPLGRLIQPEAIADTAIEILKSEHINGAIVTADEGWSP